MVIFSVEAHLTAILSKVHLIEFVLLNCHLIASIKDDTLLVVALQH